MASTSSFFLMRSFFASGISAISVGQFATGFPGHGVAPLPNDLAQPRQKDFIHSGTRWSGCKPGLNSWTVRDRPQRGAASRALRGAPAHRPRRTERRRGGVFIRLSIVEDVPVPRLGAASRDGVGTAFAAAVVRRA